MSDAVDSSNKFCVTQEANGRLTIRVPPLQPLTRTDALVLAAWLVALADRRPGRDDSEFGAILKTILGS